MCLFKATPANRFFTKISPVGFFTVLLAIFLSSAPAYAHKVTIFAWVEGDMVHTQSKFSGGRKVKNAPVEVYDVLEKKLLEGRTDERGEFKFKSPGKGPLRIVLIAAMGHKAHWTLSADELAGSVESSEASTPTPLLEKTDSGVDTASASSGEQNQTADIQMAIQTAVEKALDKKLKPVIGLLVDTQNPDPSFRDIMGGLGYILGLVGLGAYFNYRRREAGRSS